MNPMQHAQLPKKNFLKALPIPAQPANVVELGKLFDQPLVDANRIIAVLETDVSLTAKMLRLANSPMFAAGRVVNSVGQALNIMGLEMFRRVVIQSALREALCASPGEIFELFWRHSQYVAVCCEMIAKRCARGLMGHAYLTGLFHDCAVPVMQEKFGDYQEILRYSLDHISASVVEEDQRYATNHCIVGYFFAKSWMLPDSVCIAILHHHDNALAVFKDGEAKKLAAVLLLSEFIIKDFDASGNERAYGAKEWVEEYWEVATLLDIGVDHVLDFMDSFGDKLDGAV